MLLLYSLFNTYPVSNTIISQLTTNYSIPKIQNLLENITTICTYNSIKDNHLIHNTICIEFTNNIIQSIFIIIVLWLCCCGLLESLIDLKYKYNTYRSLH